MESSSIDSVVEETPLEMASDDRIDAPGEPVTSERPPLKTRHRILNSIQRMGSSQSLIGITRPRSQSLRSGGKASISCVSLTSGGSSYSYSYPSELSAGYSTAPTSVANTPGPSPVFDDKPRLRTVTPNGPSSIPLPSDLRPWSRNGAEAEGDYFSQPLKKKPERRPNFNFWRDLPMEIRMYILRHLPPKEIVRLSAVSKSWHAMCFDGQLWRSLDTSEFYRDIPAESLVNIITSAGPFVRHLNLRGCVQLYKNWYRDGFNDACKNLENLSLEGCRIDRTAIHSFLLQNSRLVSINLSGLAGATNTGMTIIGEHCPRVEHLNVSWCHNIDTRGLKKVVEGCPNLKDLRAGEVRGFDDVDLMNELFKRNTLERLVLMNCDSLSDESLTALVEGVNSEVDVLTGRPIVPPRRLKHLDLTRCRGISDAGVRSLVGNVPNLEGLQLSKCHSLTDEVLTELLPSCPVLTHLELEELEHLTNEALKTLSTSPCAPYLQHLCISYCENLGDLGILAILKGCTSIASLELDNSRTSDLVLAEAASVMRKRNRAAKARSESGSLHIGLKMVVYDCPNVTWSGIREVLYRNEEIARLAASADGTAPTYPHQIIGLKCFYNWQPTVEEHTKRVLRGDIEAANRLQKGWAKFMILNEEAGVNGSGTRRRRRRAREAQEMYQNEEDGGAAGAGGPQQRLPVIKRTGATSLMDAFRLRSLPPDMYYIPNFITAEEEASILVKIPAQRWVTLSHRRLQAHPSTLTKTNTLLAAPLPSYLLDPIVDRFSELGIFDHTPHKKPNHVLINEYKKGEGIMMHEDGSAYASVVATVSLGAAICLELAWKKEKLESQGLDISSYNLPTRILQEPRSLLITTGAAYADLLHGISPIEVDQGLSAETVANWEFLGDRTPFENAGGQNHRGTRISLTYRDVLKVSSAASKVFGGLGTR
ncbi:RNI-like protein [Westerdykella ornata]|uniref:RNI-like protein n=1 Tax=Westerdykella ornata TaxID=318751 RepID=A0A6A6JFF6_WESOR|nr:RNI-like protein [Westerdykella ornata]KAF2274944.1 RNI-like protein [Westerdykella ornata]